MVAYYSHMDNVFKALADQTRRHLLDELRESDGMTLSALCEQLDISRQAVTKHLQILEQANLVVPIREGRFKKHYLNPIPIQQLIHRWVGEFQQTRADAVISLKLNLEQEQ